MSDEELEKILLVGEREVDLNLTRRMLEEDLLDEVLSVTSVAEAIGFFRFNFFAFFFGGVERLNLLLFFESFKVLRATNFRRFWSAEKSKRRLKSKKQKSKEQKKTRVLLTSCFKPLFYPRQKKRVKNFTIA